MRLIRQPFASHSPEENKLMLRWMAVTSFGLAAGFVLAEFISAALSDENGMYLLAPQWLLLLGACVGGPALIGQYLLLRRHVPGTHQWLVAGILASVGAIAGGWMGYAGGMLSFLVLGLLSSACVAATGGAAACFPPVFFLAFVAAGAVAGMVIGGVMGFFLRNDSVEWTKDWTGRLSSSWALVGAIFWAAVPLQGWFTGGVLNSSVTLASLAIAAGVGLLAGATGGLVSGCQYVRVLRPHTPGTAPSV